MIAKPMNLSENRISSTFYVLLTALVSLSIACYLIPESFFEEHNIKKVDYINPVVLKKEPVVKAPSKQLALAKKKKKVTTASLPKELTPIEDYSDGKQLELLMQALYNTKYMASDSRIAFFGDSFIEGDILTMDLRDSLQKSFGGDGIGFLPMSSEVPMFRKSMPSEPKDWEEISIHSKSGKENIGIAGTVYVPKNDAEIKLLAPEAMHSIELIYKNTGAPVTVENIYNKNILSDTVPSSNDIALHPLMNSKENIRNYQLKMQGHENMKVYGLNITNGNGIYLDNFSTRGNSGLGLKQIADSQYVEFQKIMNYKLVVLQFGLNAAMAKTTDFSNYEKHMINMINHLKTLFPETSFLLLSTSDRSYKENGSFVTMPSIPLLVEAQKRIAQETGILFWNMYEGMGGENSMVTLVKDKKANKDYTHLNFGGGTIVADKLYKALMYEYRNYEKNKASEKTSLAIL